MVLFLMSFIKPASAELLDQDARRAALLGALSAQALPTPGGTGKLPFGTAAAILLDNEVDPAAIEYIASSGHGGEPPFNAMYQLRGYFANRPHFNEEQRGRIHAAGLAVPDWNQDYTENHRVLLWSSAYLFAQEFPTGQWNWGSSTLSSAGLLAAAKQAIADYGKGVFAHGYSDFLSPVYDAYKVAAWMNLYDFAQDDEVRAMADALLTYHVANLVLGSFEEVILAPNARAPGNAQSRLLTTESQWLLWLYYGHGNPGTDDLARPSQPQFIHALSSWQPPELFEQISARQAIAVPYTFRTQQPYFLPREPNYMRRTTWQHPQVALSSGVFELRPDTWLPYGARHTVNDDVFNIAWESAGALRALSVMHPYWNSSAGENVWSNRHSPFMQVSQHEASAIVLFDIPVDDPFADDAIWSDGRADSMLPIAQLRFPSTGLTFTNYEDGWISLSSGSVYIAIHILQPGWTRDRRILDAEGFHVIKSRGQEGSPWQTGFLFEVGTESEFGSLNTFMDAVRAHSVTWQADPFSVTWRNSRGQLLDMTFNSSTIERIGVPEFTVNHEQIAYTDWPHLESPWTSLENGILQVRQGHESAPVLQIDWTGEVPIRSSSPRDWMGWPIVDGWSDTGKFLGPVLPLAGHEWVYVYQLDRYVYVPDQANELQGAWIYLPR